MLPGTAGKQCTSNASRSNLASMNKLTLADFDRIVTPTLSEYAAIECISPNYDADWQSHGHIDRAMELLASWARERTFKNASIEIHRLPGRTPLMTVTVEATGPGTSTAVLYGHMDKQPPLGDWSEGLAPFAPVRRGDRLYARGVADDGYSTFAALMALEAMEAQGIAHSRCVVLIEASEESGSPDLEAYMDHLSDHLGDVDFMICLDSGAITYDRLWVTTSLRGGLMLKVNVQVVENGIHSGMASGVVPSSFRVLRQFLDLLEDAQTGEIHIKDLYVTIPDDITANAEALANEFGDLTTHGVGFVGRTKPMGSSAAERIVRKTWYPTVSYVGIDGVPSIADGGAVLRPFTSLSMSLRLPPTLNCEQAIVDVKEYFKDKLPQEAEVSIEISGFQGWQAPKSEPWLEAALEEASQNAFGSSPGFTGEGGSIPFLAALGVRYPKVQFVATGVLGPDSNAHGIDEMLDIPMAVNVTNSVITLLSAHANK
jgi:acetylornithine deacetylase/succinyl-diaminopimelate desuccinylase-like protein